MTHHFTLILNAPAEFEEFEELEDLLFEAGCNDALLGVSEGSVYLDFDRESEDDLSKTILQAIQEVEKVAGVRVVRVEPDDLVTLSGIAERTSRSRESVRLLVVGQRGAGTFPRPVHGFRATPKLWRWVEVAEWMAVHLETTLKSQEPRSRRRKTGPKLKKLRQDLEKARLELNRARIIAAFNGGLAVRENFSDSASAAGLMNLVVTEQAREHR